MRRQTYFEINVRDGWENHSQPAKDAGIRCIRYQDCTCSQIWQFPKAMCRIKQIVPIAVSFLKFPWGHYVPVGSAMLAYCTVMMAYCKYMLIIGHIVHVCWHVVHVCWHGVCNECYRYVRNLVPQSAPLSLATPLYRFRKCGEQ